MWHDLKKDPPVEGVAVMMSNKTVGYYCDGEFYFLKYDPHLGVLRKEHVNDKIEYWTEIRIG